MSDILTRPDRVHAAGADSSETHERILDAAESLFGEMGFVSTSVRDVATRANTSPGSINYYFGSKNGLIRAVIHRIGVPLNETRLARIASLSERYGAQPIPLPELLRSFLEPLYKDDSDTRREVISRLLTQVTVATDPQIGAYWTEILGPTGKIYVTNLQRALPNLDPAEVFLRYQFFLMATYDSRAFSGWYWDWAKAEFGLEAETVTLNERIAMFTHMFAAPGRNDSEISTNH